MMKNRKKLYNIIKISIIFSFIIISFFKQTYIYSSTENNLGTGYNPENVIENPGPAVVAINGTVDNFLNTIFLIFQVTSVAAVVYVGVSYMFASADNKAEIKNKLIYLIIGVILIFGTRIIIEFITASFYDISGY